MGRTVVEISEDSIFLYLPLSSPITGPSSPSSPQKQSNPTKSSSEGLYGLIGLQMDIGNSGSYIFNLKIPKKN